MSFAQYLFTQASGPASTCPDSRTGELFAVTAFDSTHVWVGGADAFYGLDHPFAARWDGSGWVPTTLHTTGYKPIVALRGKNTTHLWAAGNDWLEIAPRPTTTDVIQMYHWDGTAWTDWGGDATSAVAVVDANVTDPEGYGAYPPTSGAFTTTGYGLYYAGTGGTWDDTPFTPTSSQNGLRSPYGAAARGAGEVWVCGEFGSGAGDAAYVERVLGGAGGSELFLDPSSFPSSAFFDVTCVDTTDVFTVGVHLDETSGSGFRRACAWQSHSGTWTELAMPAHPDPVLTTNYQFMGVSAVTPTDVWAVGSWQTIDDLDQVPETPLIAHWDGTAWTYYPLDRAYVNLLTGPGSGAHLNRVWMLSATDGWAVGRACDQMLVCHFTGGAWHTVPLP